MDIAHHHVIRRAKLEISAENANQAKALQKMMHKTIMQLLTPLLSKLFAQYVPDNVIIHLDKLVIDAGVLNTNSFKRKLPLQIETKLVPMLQAAINKAMQYPHRYTPLPEAQLQAIAHYLSEGYIAWWMPEHRYIEKRYIDLLQHAPLQIEKLWYSFQKTDKAIQRFINSFARTTVIDTLKLFWKPQDFTTTLTAIISLLHQTGMVTNGSYYPTQQLLAIALSNILKQQRRSISQIDFSTLLLKKVAMHTSMDYATMLTTLQRYYAQNKKSMAPLTATIQTLLGQLQDLAISPPHLLA